MILYLKLIYRLYSPWLQASNKKIIWFPENRHKIIALQLTGNDGVELAVKGELELPFKPTLSRQRIFFFPCFFPFTPIKVKKKIQWIKISNALLWVLWPFHYTGCRFFVFPCTKFFSTVNWWKWFSIFSFLFDDDLKIYIINQLGMSLRRAFT